MAILESVKKLASKVGAETNGRTIAEQINNINRKLDDSYVGSRNIAEAVNKFADKEDGTAILSTKTITENGTYAASDDGVSGYSSVTVDVESSMSLISSYVGWIDYSHTTGVYQQERKLFILRSSTGIYDLNLIYDEYGSGNVGHFVLVNPVVKVFGFKRFEYPQVTFTPDTNYDGFYNTDGVTKIVFPGDEVTPEDGKVYLAAYYMGPGTLSMKKFNHDFTFTME